MDIGNIKLELRGGTAQQFAANYTQAAVLVLKAVQAVGENDLEDAAVTYTKACFEIWSSEFNYTLLHYLVICRRCHALELCS